MNQETTKADLLHYLEDPGVNVIAFKGGWGTGKTHLWKEIKDSLKPVKESDHLYASCFGVESLDQLKMALFQNSLGKAEETVSAARKFSDLAVDVFERISAKFVPGVEGLATVVGGLSGVVQSTLFDRILRSRLIVLDDVERRSSLLTVETLLGFIDLLKRNECKILLILNEEPLEQSNASDWRKLKEKCFDREIMLLTTPAEAAGIGLGKCLPYRAIVIEVLARLGVSNIRVIQRIDRVITGIFQGECTLQLEIQQSMLPTVVALTALNFNAVPGGPDFTSLMNEWPEWCSNGRYYFDGSSGTSDAVAFAKNVPLTEDLQFLELVRQHILTGNRLQKEFKDLFEKQKIKQESDVATREAVLYLFDKEYDPHVTDAALIQKADDYKSKWASIDPKLISAIVFDLEQRNADELAKEMASLWVGSWIKKGKLGNGSNRYLDKLHPTIKKGILEGNDKLASPQSLIKSVIQVCSREYAPSDIEVIENASVNEVKDAIKRLDRNNFSSFVYFFRTEIQKIAEGEMGRVYSQSGTEAFQSAVRKIMEENESPRLEELLKFHLGDSMPC